MHGDMQINGYEIIFYIVIIFFVELSIVREEHYMSILTLYE